MRFYIGILSIITSLIILTVPIFLLDYSYLFEKLVATLLIVVTIFLLISGINNLSTFYKFRKIKNSGYRTKAKIIKVQRTLLAIKSAPNYILEVIYEHPKNHKNYQTYLDYYNDSQMGKDFLENQYIDIIIDPENPDIVMQKSL